VGMKGLSKADEVLRVDGDDAPSGGINIRNEGKGDADDDWHDKSDALGILGSYIETNHQVATNGDGPHETPCSDRDAIPPGCLRVTLGV